MFLVRDEFGLNVAGYFTAELGLGEVARNYVAAIRSLGVNVALQDASFLTNQRKGAAFEHQFSESCYTTNLVCVNALEMPQFLKHFGASYLRTKYNIGSWWWELENIPQEWQCQLPRFDELWVGTRFIQENFQKVSPIPVFVIPPYVVPVQASPRRKKFGLSPDEFVFVFAFDYFSSFERKNPLAIIDAFLLAFKKGEPAKLIIKSTNADKFPHQSRLLETAAAADSRIAIIDQYMEKSGLNELIASGDAYISLHRSEGFGLPIAEAMLLEKPVIVTGWSGNLDFNTSENSLIVRHGFKTNEADCGPYKKGIRWADPDIEHAAKLMRALFEDRTYAKTLGQKGAASIRQLHGMEAVSRTIETRLRKIANKVQVVKQVAELKRGLQGLSTIPPQPLTNKSASSSSNRPYAPPETAAFNRLPGKHDQEQVLGFSSSLLLPGQADTKLDRLVARLEVFCTNWWHRPLLGIPLRLLTKCFARLMYVQTFSENGRQLRNEIFEESFEGVTRLAKANAERIEALEERLKSVEESATDCSGNQLLDSPQTKNIEIAAVDVDVVSTWNPTPQCHR
jgi:glycosyltransferase involved in cell wall biosynthesis